MYRGRSNPSASSGEPLTLTPHIQNHEEKNYVSVLSFGILLAGTNICHPL